MMQYVYYLHKIYVPTNLIFDEIDLSLKNGLTISCHQEDIINKIFKDVELTLEKKDYLRGNNNFEFFWITIKDKESIEIFKKFLEKKVKTNFQKNITLEKVFKQIDITKENVYEIFPEFKKNIKDLKIENRTLEIIMDSKESSLGLQTAVLEKIAPFSNLDKSIVWGETDMDFLTHERTEKICVKIEAFEILKKTNA